MYGALLEPGESVSHAPRPGAQVYVHVARGRVDLNGAGLAGGDGAAVSDEAQLRLTAVEGAEVLLFDLP
jgi:hypothetical protein